MCLALDLDGSERFRSWQLRTPPSTTATYHLFVLQAHEVPRRIRSSAVGWRWLRPHFVVVKVAAWPVAVSKNYPAREERFADCFSGLRSDVAAALKLDDGLLRQARCRSKINLRHLQQLASRRDLRTDDDHF